MGRITEILGHPDRFRDRRRDPDPRAPHPAPLPGDCWRRRNGSRVRFRTLKSRRRRYFRSFDIVTIDGETARDFDDAVW